MLDFNCFIGPWPFHPVAVETMEQLRKLHKENGIEGGFVSNLKSVFYRDFFYSEEELHAQLKHTGYRQIMTVNPQHPACLDVVRYGIENWNIAGVRIVPGYHQYGLNDPVLEPLCSLLTEKGLPLYLSVSLEDRRSCYLLLAQPVVRADIQAFLEAHPDLTVLIAGASTGEINGLRDSILKHKAAFFDLSGCRHGNELGELFGAELSERMVYGSMAGLLCLKSSLLRFEAGEFNREQTVNSGMGTAFLEKCPGIK